MIKVAALTHPLSLEKLGNDSIGLEADLIKNFAQNHNFNIQWNLKKRLPKELQQYDILAFRFIGDYKIKNFISLPYQDTDIILLCSQQKNRNSKILLPINLQSAVIEEKLKKLNLNFVHSNKFSHQLFSDANHNQNFCFVCDKFESMIFLPLSENLRLNQTLIKNIQVSILFKKNKTSTQEARDWLYFISRNRDLFHAKQNYSFHFSSINKQDIQHFSKSLNDRFASYRHIFEAAATDNEISWRLLSAIGYQESHWNSENISYTGVKGLMMITEQTADHLGISNRTDPEQSIFGAARYMKYLLDSQPDHIFYKDRLALALVAYNIGLGGLKETQNLALKQGLNPYSWGSLKSALKKISTHKDKNIRGLEAINFTERVLSFFEILRLKY